MSDPTTWSEIRRRLLPEFNCPDPREFLQAFEGEE